jgi:hypothetical protein
MGIYSSLELITDDPERFRHMLGRTNAGEYYGWLPGTVRVGKISRCLDPGTLAIRITFHSGSLGEPDESTSIDFGPLVGALDGPGTVAEKRR